MLLAVDDAERISQMLRDHVAAQNTLAWIVAITGALCVAILVIRGPKP